MQVQNPAGHEAVGLQDSLSFHVWSHWGQDSGRGEGVRNDYDWLFPGPVLLSQVRSWGPGALLGWNHIMWALQVWSLHPYSTTRHCPKKNSLQNSNLSFLPAFILWLHYATSLCLGSNTDQDILQNLGVGQISGPNV